MEPPGRGLKSLRLISRVVCCRVGRAHERIELNCRLLHITGLQLFPFFLCTVLYEAEGQCRNTYVCSVLSGGAGVWQTSVWLPLSPKELCVAVWSVRRLARQGVESRSKMAAFA